MTEPIDASMEIVRRLNRAPSSPFVALGATKCELSRADHQTASCSSITPRPSTSWRSPREPEKLPKRWR